MKYGFKDYAYDVLKAVKKPMGYKEIWEKGKQLGCDVKLGSKGKTPWESLGAQLYVDVKSVDSKFFLISKKPTLFALVEYKDNYSDQEIRKMQEAEENPIAEAKYHERDLHPVLVKYLYGNRHFSCLTRTIFHEKSSKGKMHQDMWTYPDLIGVYFPYDDFELLTLSTLEILNQKPFKIFSFEVKKTLDLSTLREKFFQAVSNSSWANEGYLVAAEISDDDKFMSELSLLNSGFGIGVIKLNIEFPEQSEILFYAKPKTNIDINMLDKLINKNSDVQQIFNCVEESNKLSRVVNMSQFDKILDEIEYEKHLNKFSL
ncbi:MAG: HrgA protein [Ruminococcus sp.]|nr:HrgA protein [Ruminococcus sp.]